MVSGSTGQDRLSPQTDLLPPVPPSTASSLPAPNAMPSFFKRPLPSTCIGFDSTEGKQLFQKALIEGFMEKYFSLAQSFLTQNEPAFCGLATLCMILNALGVDPQKQFKGPWRYYSQEMLDCCRSLSDVADSGITLAEFACLARCNGLREYTRYGTMVTLKEFERDLERVCGTNDDGSVMAISYSRKSLGQTGDGHFSPIGGYCKSDRKLLILDVARFKLPSYWISLEDAFASMIPIDRTTGQPRGYSILRKASLVSPTAPTSGLFSLGFNKQTWPAFLKLLKASTGPSTPIASASSAEDLVNHLVKLIHTTQARPLQQRDVSVPPAQATAEQQLQQMDALPAQMMSDLYDAEIRQLTASMKASQLWRLVSAALHDNPTPFPYDSPYPQMLSYSLFLHALLTSISAPSKLRHLWHRLSSSHDLLVGYDADRVKKECRFLQDQMHSLESCCSTEEACSCAGKGLPGACKV